MKRSRAFYKETGKFAGIMIASGLDEAQRYAFAYRCSENGCGCTVHWRKMVRAHQNTETRPATFVKNPSSSHVSGCFQDYERIARESSDYTYFKDGVFHVRINFPMGVGRSDIYPMRGYLSDQQILAAHNAKSIQPFSSLKDLAAFIEKKLGALDSQDMPDIAMHYQGHEILFDDKIIGNLNYKRLYDLSIKKDHSGDTPAVVVVVKPDHEIGKNPKGKRRFVCEPQVIDVNGRKRIIKPVIVCFNDGASVVRSLEDQILKRGTIVLVTRPFSSGSLYAQKEMPVYLGVGAAAQMASVDPTYWRSSPQAQFDFMPRPGGPHPAV